MTARGLNLSAVELAARVMNDQGQIKHGRASAGLSARVATLDGRVGVVVGLFGSYPLYLRVVWLPDGRVSRTAAAATARAYRAGLREWEDRRAAGLVAVDAWLDPNRAACAHVDPYHFGDCTRLVPGPEAD